MEPVLICYNKCTTCRKAEKWLKENGISYTKRDIVQDHPTKEELEKWIARGNLDPTKMFNTHGGKYRELDLKNKLKTMTEEEMVDLLASDGMLVKRPLLVGDSVILQGFNEAEWKDKLQ